MLRWVRPALLVIALALPCLAEAFTANIAPGDRSLYLRVGDGRFTSEPFCRPGTTPPCANWEFRDAYLKDGGFATVGATVPADALGNGTPIWMTADATDRRSHYDDRILCEPGELYVGGFYRRPGNAAFVAELAIQAPPVLSNGAGATLPISEIFWVSSEATLPGRTLAGGSQIIARFPANIWQESCQRFYYRNASVPAAGTYQATVTYTLTAP